MTAKRGARQPRVAKAAPQQWAQVYSLPSGIETTTEAVLSLWQEMDSNPWPAAGQVRGEFALEMAEIVVAVVRAVTAGELSLDQALRLAWTVGSRHFTDNPGGQIGTRLALLAATADLTFRAGSPKRLGEQKPRSPEALRMVAAVLMQVTIKGREWNAGLAAAHVAAIFHGMKVLPKRYTAKTLTEWHRDYLAAIGQKRPRGRPRKNTGKV